MFLIYGRTPVTDRDTIPYIIPAVHQWPSLRASKGRQTSIKGRNSSLVVFGLAVHSVAVVVFGLAVYSVAGFPVEGIFPLELTWVQTLFPPKLFRMKV